MNKKYLVFSLILFISIGFAILSSNLNILGRFQFLESSFEVYFDNIRVISNSIEAANPVIDNNKTTITFGGTFYEPGDVYEYSVDVVNNGTMGAMLDEIIKTGITSENEDFINYTVNYFDGTSLNRYDLLKAGAKTRIIVKVEYKYDIEELPNISNNMGFSLSLKYVKSNNKAIDVDTNFYNSEKNNNFALSNTKANSLMDLKIYGNTEQLVFAGPNLYNYKDVSSYINAITNGAVADEDGWITMSYDNTEGSSDVYSNYYTNNLNVDINKNYTLVMEVKSVTGSDEILIYPTSYYNDDGQFLNRQYEFSQIKSNSVIICTIKHASNNNSLNGLRTFVQFPIGTSGSITFRLSVIEGTGTDVIANNLYVGEKVFTNINSVTGNTTLKIQNKNLFNLDDYYSNAYPSNATAIKTNNGIILNFTEDADAYIGNAWNSSMYSQVGYSRRGDKIEVKENTTYTLSVSSTPNCYISFADKYFNILNTDYIRIPVSSESTSYTFTTPSNTKYIFLRFGIHSNNVTSYTFSDIQLEENNTASSFKFNQKNSYLLSLSNLELNKIGNYRDYIYNINNKWYIHKEIDKYTMTGSEQVSINTESDNTTLLVYNNVLGSNAKDYNSSISNRLQYNKMLNSDEEGFYFDENSKNLTLRINKSTIGTTGSDVSTYFSNHETSFYYVLASPKDIEITDSTLVGQLNAIYNNGNNNLYDGINNVIYTSNIDTDIEFNYQIN